ncbi:tyrosine-type recombinase/integrase [candidate division KSB1 bacterium]|nr:tyrosine-type recombinase/integrase [candidate division KSB1 bacterium]
MKPTNFAYHLTTYLSKYLPGKAGISRNTVMSYRDTFSLLLRFCSEDKAVTIERITLKTLTKELIDEFLIWLETQRGCTVSTRNQRLAAIHSFFRYLQLEEPGHLFMCQQILAIPMKRTARRAIHYLTLDAIKTILKAPDTTCLMGRRDLVLLSLMYDTGARVQEVADLTVADVRLENPPTIKLTGKGNRSRLVPLMTPTAKLLDQYLSEHDLKHPQYGSCHVFQNRSDAKLTRAGITYILSKYVEAARVLHPELIPKKISPHCFRHSKAMHLLQSGVNLIYIRDFLGHVTIKTTEMYARADSRMKRKALENAHQITSPSKMPVWQQNHSLLKWLKELGH